jgi:vacuolar-type H+-ATPase subunit I/STV1
MSWKKLFNNDYVLKFIKYYNLIMLILYTLGCYIYLFDNETYKYIYKVLISILGFNISSQIFVGYLLSKLKFCRWQILAFIFNFVINILGVGLSLISNFYTIKYDDIAMTVLCTIFTTFTLSYIIWERKRIQRIIMFKK